MGLAGDNGAEGRGPESIRGKAGPAAASRGSDSPRQHGHGEAGPPQAP